MSQQSKAVLLVLSLAGCDARSLVVGESSTTGGFEGQRERVQQRCPDAARARTGDEECWPTRHVGSWRGFVTGDARYWHLLAEPLQYTSGEVLLEIDEQGTGTLSFAEDIALRQGCARDGGAQPPVEAGVLVLDAGAGAADAGALGSCGGVDAGAPMVAGPGLLAGHRYSLEALSMSGGPSGDRTRDPSVDFYVPIAAPGEEHCESALTGELTAPCSCGDAGCGVATAVVQASLSLSRDGQALRGTLTSSGEPELVAGLELVRQ